MLKIAFLIISIAIAILIGIYVIRMDENYSNLDYFSDKSEKFTVSEMYNMNPEYQVSDKSIPHVIYLKQHNSNCPYQNVPF